MHIGSLVKSKNNKLYNHFELNDFKVGTYRIIFEFKDYSTWQKDFYLHCGLNQYKLTNNNKTLQDNFNEVDEDVKEDLTTQRITTEKVMLKNMMSPISELPIAENQSMNNKSFVTKETNQSAVQKTQSNEKENAENFTNRDQRRNEEEEK